jgi:hypothetical protein
VSAGRPPGGHGASAEAAHERTVLAIGLAVRSDANVWGSVRDLLAARKTRMPVSVALERLAAMLGGVVDAALTEAVEEDEEHLDQIRGLFLEPRERYSADALASLWRVHRDDLFDIYHDRIVQSQSSLEELRVEWADVIRTSVAYYLLRPFDVERALGEDFSFARPERWKTVPILIRIPRFVASALAPASSLAPKLALARRLEQIVLEFFTAEHLTGSVSNEVPPQ